MYDLNLSVPNITSPKYSDDNRFLLLKNYLYELNEALAHALEDKTQSQLPSIENKIEAVKKNQGEIVTILSETNREKFSELKEKILSTAESLENIRHKSNSVKNLSKICNRSHSIPWCNCTTCSHFITAYHNDCNDTDIQYDIHTWTHECEKCLYS